MYKGISAACLLSALTAGVICMLASPVTAEKAAAVTISVNRAGTGSDNPDPPEAGGKARPVG